MKWKVGYFQLNHFSGPYRQLAKCLASPKSDILVPEREKVSPLFEDEIWERLRREDNRGLCDLYEESEYLEDYNLLIMIDQFENLFSGAKFRTEVRNEDQKNFIRLLLKASMEEQRIYLMVSIRPPKSDRWKYQFKDLSDAMIDTEFPLYALDQEGLEKAIWRSYQEESIMFQQRYHQQRQGTVPPNLKPFALDKDKHRAWAEQLYFHEDPLTAMGSLVSETVIADWKNKDESQLFDRRGGHSFEDEDDREAQDSMVEMDPDSYETGPVEESVLVEEEAEILYGDLVAKAENLYQWLTPLEKRVAQKFFVQLTLAGGPLTLADAVNNIGRFESLVYQVADKYVNEGVLRKSPMGPLDGASEVEWVEVEVEDTWERLAGWGDRAGLTPRKVTRSTPNKSTVSAKSKAPARESQPARGGGDTPTARKAEHIFSELTPLQKRITEKIFVALAQNDGSATLGDISSQIGRFETLIPGVAEHYSKMGVLEAEGHADDPGTVLRIADEGLAADWDRFGTWLSRQGISIPTPSAKEDRPSQAKKEKLDSGKGGGKKKKSPEARKEAPPKAKTSPKTKTPKKQPRTQARTPARGGAAAGGGDNKAEAHFQSLTPLEKRVSEKIFVTLSHNGGSMLVGDLVDAIGRFEGIIRNLVEEWDRVKVLDCDGRDDENKVALTDLELSSNWKRFDEWLKRA